MTKGLWHSVGFRLLAGFWITLLTAIVCTLLLAKWTGQGLDFARMQDPDKRILHLSAQRLMRLNERGVDVAEMIEKGNRRNDIQWALLNLATEQVLIRPHRNNTKVIGDINRLSDRQRPIKLIRPQYQLIGPKSVTLAGQEYLFFVQQRIQPPPPRQSRVVFVVGLVFVLSILFTLVFSKSLVRPIKNLKETSQKIATGDWSARADTQKNANGELGELAETFNHMAEKIEANWQSQQRLLADVSHELRSPLTRMNMAVALAEQAAQDNPVVKEAMLRIEQETARMDELIGNVLTLSRTDAAMSQLESVPLSSLLQAVVTNAEFEAQQMNKTLRVASLPSQPVWVHKEAAQSAIENVLRNALRYAATEVKLTIDMPETSPESSSGFSQWSVIISDDGPGLAQADLEAVFKPFYRAELARDRQSGGVGLGLAIAKAAVTAHHGSITARNRDDGGLAVTLVFKNRTT